MTCKLFRICKSRQLILHFFKNVKELLYPSLCIHCEEFLSPNFSILCGKCFLDMELLPLEDRCYQCFNLVDDAHKTCKKCHTTLFTRLIAAFPLVGPSATLCLKLKSLQTSYLCQAASALMAVQLIKAHIPFPDTIVPLPQKPSEKYFSCYDYNFYMAQALCEILGKPMHVPFSFNLKKMDYSKIDKAAIRNKNLLLVGDILTNQGRMHQYAEVLSEGYPKNIYGIALCQII